jgi:hypothetical protein
MGLRHATGFVRAERMRRHRARHRFARAIGRQHELPREPVGIRDSAGATGYAWSADSRRAARRASNATRRSRAILDVSHGRGSGTVVR